MSNHIFKAPNFSSIGEQRIKYEENGRTIDSFFQSLQSMNHDRTTNEKDFIEFLSKKNPKPSLPLGLDTKSEKTTKIRKNKKKKKKKPNQCNTSKGEKFMPHELYQCLPPQPIQATRQNEEDDYQFLSEDPEYINGAISSIREELLQAYYEDIQKDYLEWLKEKQENPGETFMIVLRKLADLFQTYGYQLHEAIESEFGNFNIADVIKLLLRIFPQSRKMSRSLRITQQPISQFQKYEFYELFEDFLDNFDLKNIDQSKGELTALCQKNLLISEIYNDLLERNKKKKKNKRRKNKKKKYKQKTMEDQKQQTSATTTDPDKFRQISVHLALQKEEDLEISQKKLSQQISESFDMLKIDDQIRTKCSITDQWLKELKEKVLTS